MIIMMLGSLLQFGEFVFERLFMSLVRLHLPVYSPLLVLLQTQESATYPLAEMAR